MRDTLVGAALILAISALPNCAEAKCGDFIYSVACPSHTEDPAGWLKCMKAAAGDYPGGPCEQKPGNVVTPEKVCAVQNAIRFQAKAWAPWMCLRVATAINDAAAATDTNPATLLAIATNESDLRPAVSRDVYPSPTERELYPLVDSVHDGGLMGIRCRIGADFRCSNGLVKGMKWPQTMHLETNVMLGARILAASGNLRAYNGQSKQGEKDARKAKRMTYAEKIGALEAALRGEQVAVKGKRMRELVRKIVAAVTGEART